MALLALFRGGQPHHTVFSLLVQHNIQKTVRVLWQQLVAQRRQTLEDAFKIDLSVKAGESEVKIEEVTPLWEETMLRAWQHYLGLCPSTQVK